MIGVRAWSAADFHPNCPDVSPVDIGGFLYLWCYTCRCLCNLEAVCPKFLTYGQAVVKDGSVDEGEPPPFRAPQRPPDDQPEAPE